MKNCLFILLFLIFLLPVSADNLLNETLSGLDDVIAHKQEYVQQKEIRIASIKRMLTSDLSPIQEYQFNKNLYKEYLKFKSDSAIYYVKKNLEIAKELGQKELIDATLLQLPMLYSSSGLFRESEAILKSMSSQNLSPELRPCYYEAYKEFFEHYASESNWKLYSKQITLYRDSLLSVLDPFSIKYQINLAERKIYARELDEAEKNLQNLLHSIDANNDPNFAMVTYLLGNVYRRKGNREEEKRYFTLSSIMDIKNAIKDNASIQSLASIFYEEGDINRAYKYSQSAIEDAVFCNVQFRTIQMSEFYSIINMAYLDKEAKRKSQLQIYLTLISILSVFLILAVIYVYKQMKKVSRIREELSETNNKLVALNKDMSLTNDQLQDKNAQLSESNHIKEEYIAHFFDLCSTYITKLEDYRKALHKKAVGKQLDELFKMLRSTTVIENELEELYRTFDNIFLNLYPTFVEEFNALLIKEEQIVLKPGELLNTELRIFALIRLGITDSVKIAAFLRYSLSTIYNYRTKGRNKAVVSRDEFEKMVMKIGAIPLKPH
ncbi:DUF6377 domain-containing protein [Bacteroides sp. 51]|uniref:DUF6377 domain-containing protein n=1 Tax=Bacteroides sp. 51 TaxID=2302938 RepID=UPI0013D33BB1|nr:DUF6377 domain-containing protein [Bacteroides sp. 51]NDV83329.1 hypothetical protein [Bacteroides sp. 51]